MPAPDLIMHGGKVITLDRGSRIAEAVAVRGDQITEVGDSARLLAQASPRTRTLDLHGRAVVPGFCDAHPHVDREGLKRRGGIAVEGVRSVGAIVDVVRDAVRAARPGAWIVVMPLGSPPHDYVSRADQLDDGRFPSRHDLDVVAPDNPVYIRAVWGWWSHRPFPSIANSQALRRAGVPRDTVAPYNVEIVRDAQGEPTGVFLERNFVPVLEYTLFKSLPRFTHEDRVASVRLGARAYAAAGTTATFEGHGLTPAVTRAYGDVHAAGELPLRMHTPLSVPSNAFDDARLVDLFYQQAAVAAGRGVGDDLEYAISAYEAIDRAVPIRDRRWVVIHVNQATPEQLTRMRDLGVVATATPGFLYLAGDRYGLDQLGERAVPLREMLDARVPVALGTDGVPCSMLWTMWEA